MSRCTTFRRFDSLVGPSPDHAPSVYQAGASVAYCFSLGAFRTTSFHASCSHVVLGLDRPTSSPSAKLTKSLAQQIRSPRTCSHPLDVSATGMTPHHRKTNINGWTLPSFEHNSLLVRLAFFPHLAQQAAVPDSFDSFVTDTPTPGLASIAKHCRWNETHVLQIHLARAGESHEVSWLSTAGVTLKAVVRQEGRMIALPSALEAKEKDLVWRPDFS
jgi:hypothetical protein